ncbi:hypothetical protein D3C72_2255340 [compost metagenome]
MPTLVIGEGNGRSAVIGRGLAVTTEHDQAPLGIRAQLAQVNRCAHEAAIGESMFHALLVTPGNAPLTGLDAQQRTIRHRHIAQEG